MNKEKIFDKTDASKKKTIYGKVVRNLQMIAPHQSTMISMPEFITGWRYEYYYNISHLTKFRCLMICDFSFIKGQLKE